MFAFEPAYSACSAHLIRGNNKSCRRRECLTAVTNANSNEIYSQCRLKRQKYKERGRCHLPAWSRPLISELSACLSFKSVPLLLEIVLKHRRTIGRSSMGLLELLLCKIVKLIGSYLELVVTVPIACSSARTSDSPPALCEVDVVHARTWQR